VSSGPVTSHLTDEDLLLDFYAEGTPSDRARVQRHLEECAECRETDRELRAVLQAVETTPSTEPPSDFERQMWARIEPHLPVARPWWRMARGLTPALYIGLAAAAGILLLVAAFSAGRLWERPAVRAVAEPSVDDRARVERLLRSEVEDHLERSQRMLVDLVNAPEQGGTFASDRARAADLVAAGRLYRRSAEEVGDADVGMLLEDLERVLVEVANSSPRDEVEELGRLRQRVEDQDLLFRLRVVARELRQSQRPATGVVVTSVR
jgi:hypothetical protein